MKRLKSLLPGVLTVLGVLACIQTAGAQTITITPAAVTDPNYPLAFNNVPVGATSRPQTITVTAPAKTTIVLQAVNTPWLLFPSGFIFYPGPDGLAIPVAVTAAELPQGTYSGSFNISVSQYVLATVYVRMTVGGASALAAYPSTLFFRAQQGATSATPASAGVVITSSGTALGYTVQTQVQPGDTNWILVNATTGISGYGSLIVQVNPSGLPAGSHTGSILVLSTSTNDSETIDVTLMVYPNSALSVSPAAPPPVFWALGANDPGVQRFTVSAAGGPMYFQARLSPPVSWAVLTPLNNSAGPYTTATLIVTFTPNSVGLRQGTYTTNLIVTPLGGSDLPGVPITLIATAYPFLQLSAASLSFSAVFGSAQTPPDQQVTVFASDGSAVGFTLASDSPWLTATVSSTATPSQLTIHVNPSGMPIGRVSGNLTILPANGDYYTETVAVTLNVVASSQISVGPSQLLFSYQTAFLPPGPQTVQVRSLGPPVSFSAATVTASCGSNWLDAVPSSNTTPATLAIRVVTAGFAPGSCQGIVVLNYDSGSGPASAIVAVTVAVSNSSELSVTLPLGFGDEKAQQGATSYLEQISLNSTDFRTPVSFSAFVSNLSGGAWLNFTGISTGLTPRTLTVQINPSAVPGPGVYSGNLVISSVSLPDGFVTIPISLTVTAGVTVSVSTTSLSFSQTQGGPAPGAQTLTLMSSGGAATFTATIPQISGGNWLRVSPTSGQANGNLLISVLSNSLTQGDYAAQILLMFQNSTTASATVNVTLHVAPPPKTVGVSPQSLRFLYQMGGALPDSQQIAITSTGGAVAFTLAVNSIGWLSADVSSGTTPKSLSVSVNAQGLTVAGSPYNGSITISAAGVLANPITIGVTLTVTPASTPVPMTISNNASGAFGVIAPGELITIKGTGLAPASPARGVLFRVNEQGNVDSILAGVRVLFSNIPGTPVYVSPEQINVIAPYEIDGRTSTNIVVEHQGIQSAPIAVAVADFAPGLYTNGGTGTGQVAAINQNGTFNGPQGAGLSPAAQDSVLTVYATGFGQTTPHSITGSVTPMPDTAADLLLVSGTVTAVIGGQPADVLFAGGAPRLVAGVIQLNIRVPKGISGDTVPISVSVNGRSTPVLGTTVAVR